MKYNTTTEDVLQDNAIVEGWAFIGIENKITLSYRIDFDWLDLSI